ncbi:DUF4105 domain-containing protein [Carboxylicivirga sp. A043]|uniref:Lnb N-terminal periplasmic domain-containing protein n=1 Tax=Carboxylicivirga litoralis TaxID=2816963 RepID=UPI0021CB5908|nr:DUF4105 domain-containing protein [Carboxylicivirga sp. A043]MCU4157927.1 DUF4105 domain-containing protein [Carboxylicivirga sp. A043]
MRHIFIIVLIVFAHFSVTAQQKLSEQAQISLLTCSPGNELYSLFGHSAIRVHDPVGGFDWVFNYGTFDFDTPNFYLKFANGNLNYMLRVGNYRTFIRNYGYEKRSVWEQKIHFTEKEKQQFFKAIVLNAQPENCYYRYDFLFDNCATRIRDIIEDNLDGGLQYDEAGAEENTYREMLHLYDAKLPWVADGLDIILGMKTDDDANLYNQMFLPDYLMQHLVGAVKADATPLLGETKTLLSFDQSIKKNWFTPALLFWLLLLISLVFMYFELKRKKAFLFVNRLFLLLTGVVGCLIFFLWFLSRHSVTGENFNMLWAIPFNVFVAFFGAWFFRSKSFHFYLLFLIICAILPIAFSWLIPQYLPSVVYPLCLLLISRYGSWYYILTRH